MKTWKQISKYCFQYSSGKYEIYGYTSNKICSAALYMLENYKTLVKRFKEDLNNCRD